MGMGIRRMIKANENIAQMRCLKCIAPLIVVEILYNTFALRV